MSEHHSTVHEPATHETRHEHGTHDHEVHHDKEGHPRDRDQPHHDTAPGHAHGSQTGGGQEGGTGTTGGSQEGGRTTTDHDPPPPPPETDEHGGAPAPSDPMTATAKALADLAVADRPKSYGQGEDLYQQFIEAFRSAESVRKVWDAHMARVERSVREFTERNGFDYKADGYADAMAELPALSGTIKEWTRLRGESPFDRRALEAMAERLRADLRQIVDRLPDSALPRDSKALLEAGVEGCAAELAVQVRESADPIGTSAAELSALSTPLGPGPSRQRFDAMLETQAPDEVWGDVKRVMMKKLTGVDKSLASKVDRAMDSGLRSTLKSWDRTIDGADGRKVLRANHDVARIVETYDERLAALDNGAQAGVHASGYITALREALRAIAASVADNTRYLADVGVLKDGR